MIPPNAIYARTRFTQKANKPSTNPGSKKPTGQKTQIGDWTERLIAAAAAHEKDRAFQYQGSRSLRIRNQPWFLTSSARVHACLTSPSPIHSSRVTQCSRGQSRSEPSLLRIQTRPRDSRIEERTRVSKFSVRSPQDPGFLYNVIPVFHRDARVCLDEQFFYTYMCSPQDGWTPNAAATSS